MNVQAEVSLYPLRDLGLSEPINRFCQALQKCGLGIETGRMSTSLAGELGQVFDGLKSAMAEIGQDHEVVLVVKVSNACPEGSASRQGERKGYEK
ncbi:MAG TPA: YkoF family thiamine/hydroxymethylpyrimidine-binding protein [Phycisphaerae bacterium]|nr:YkoF family thiamine/hydroxymethylpyrimidine-binding protein [Phycisphaerae bacterium]